MPDNIRFYLDENLRNRGIDVVTTPEAGNMGLDDEGHLAFALAEGRVIVTQDGDFLGLARKGMPHAGIVYSEPRSRTVKEIIRGLILIYEVLIPDDMRNRPRLSPTHRSTRYNLHLKPNAQHSQHPLSILS
jgi:hypothetical protein